MGKVDMPGESDFFKKIFIALLILLSLIFITNFGLIRDGYDSEKSFSKAVKIVTHVDIVSEDIGYKYIFTILSIMGEVIQFYLIYVVLEYVLDGKFKNMFIGVKHMKKAKSLNNHCIIAGGGRVGSHTADSLSKHTNNILIVDKEDENIDALRKKGYLAVKGDVLDEHFLEEINIDKAKQLIACLGDDSDNILLVLTAKELNHTIKISARANYDKSVPKLKHAGASYVVVPASIGGEELAKTAVRG